MLQYITAVTVGLFVIAIGLYLRASMRMRSYWKKRGIPYKPPALILSSLRTFISKKPIHEQYLEMYKKYGRIYGFAEFNNPLLIVCEPDLLKDILVKDFNNFHFRQDLFEIGDKYMDNMIFFLKGDDWKRVRTIITPAFTSKKMRQIAHIMNECSKTTNENFQKYAESGEPADVKKIFGAFTLDAIARSAFGTKIDSHNDPDNAFVENAKAFFGEPTLRLVLTFFLMPTWAVKLLNLAVFPASAFFKEVALKVVKERRQTGKRYNDILQLFLDAQDELENKSSAEVQTDTQTDEVDQFGSVVSNGIAPKLKYRYLNEDELIAQCILFFVVGYETTASTLSYIAYALALNPECQEKLISEVDETFRNHKEMDYDVIRGMKYLDCVISETLRMFPALTRSERTAVEDYKLGNTGLTIEKGTIIGFSIQAMHLDPEFFPNPEKFDPERFMPENVVHPQFAYLPFGAGPRNCLGMRFALMEIKMCISNVLRHYRFRKSEITKIPLEFKTGQQLLIVNELPLIIEKRN